MTNKKDPLNNWQKTTLWFKVGMINKPSLELDVWYPPNCSEAEKIRLFEKYSIQGVELIRLLTKSKDIIVQGQYTLLKEYIDD